MGSIFLLIQMSVKRIGRKNQPYCGEIPGVLFRVMDKSDYIWEHLNELHLRDLPSIVVFARALQVNGWEVTLQLPDRDGDKHALTIRRSHKRKLQ
jgi:hypothetical protein